MASQLIIISGPTASGKTTAAIDMAQHYDTEIISADSRQCYKELRIGVARPTAEQLETVPHHFIASHSIHQPVNAAGFEKYALEKARDIFTRKNVVIMVGGTGLYIKAFCEGMDPIPEVPELLRNEIINSYHINGLTWLQEEVKRLDPEFYRTGEFMNPHRLMRALEVFKATGRSILEFRKEKKGEREFNIVKLALELPKEQLHQHIDTRVDQMMESGLEEEARGLLPYQQLNPLQTVGYKELFDHFNGITGKDEAVELIKKNTRQYAKRQLTWFRKDKAYTWVAPGELKNTIANS